MARRWLRSALVVVATLLLAACGQKLDLEVKATLDGQPAPEAMVLLDGKQVGATDAQGVYAETVRQKAGAEVELKVVKDLPGYRIEPFTTKFLVKLPKEGEIDKYAYDVKLKAMRYVTLAVTEKGAPLADAVVRAGNREVGRTDAGGEFIYEYKELPKRGVDLSVSKAGYSIWRKRGPVEPGERLDVALARRAVVSVSALQEDYGRALGIPGVAVLIGDRTVGRTDARGNFTYSYDGEPGRKVPLTLSAPNHVPPQWRTTVSLDGQVNIQRYFYPTSLKPIRVGIYRFVGNTPGVDLKSVVAQTESAMAGQLYKHGVFQEVPSQSLQADIKRYRLSVDKLVGQGWQDTPLRRNVDMIVMGSVAQDDKGYILEAKFYTSGGKTILSQIVKARNERDIHSAVREIVANVIERFPFEGTVVAIEDDRYRVNIGKPFRVGRGTELTLTTPSYGESGKISGYRSIGRLAVKRADDGGAWAEVGNLAKGEKIAVGDRVVRRVYSDAEDAAKRTVARLTVKGGLAPDVAPLAGVNVYLNNDWVGTTGADGRTEIPARPGKSYNLVLYRHGYQQATDKLKIAKSGDSREFVMSVNNSLFQVESEPTGAAVYIDGERIGKTPILGGILVNLGFHTVKLSIGEDYRDWEEVLEFDKKIEDRTGGNKIVLHRDYLKIGQRALESGNVDAAIQAYASTEKNHPDYSSARHRLAQIYLDDKNDYDAAIREFENVLSLPENQQLIYKQYAVAFTNLGHAYYEKGNSLAQKDKQAAAEYFAKAVSELQTAKQNTRFFPTQHYDEALHDTHYYMALAYHKLYLVTKRPAVMDSANLAWREYFDFFPQKLAGKEAFEQSREAARKYWDEIKDQ